MSLSFEHTEVPIALLSHEKKRSAPMYLDRESKTHYPFVQYICSQGEKLQVVPNELDKDDSRTAMYVTGPAGVGKSYFIAQYLRVWQKTNKDATVYLFSAKDDDKNFKNIKNLEPIELTSDLIGENLDAKDFKNSMVIFDDVDCIGDEKLKKAVYKIVRSCFELGRSYGTSIILTQHAPVCGNETKFALLNSKMIVFFPRHLKGRHQEYLLDKQLGMNKKEISQLPMTDRWLCYYKTIPNVVCSEETVKVL